MKIGKKLIELRKSLNKTQKDVADDLGIGKATLGHWENDINEPSFQYIENICKYYKISIGELFGESPEPNPLSNSLKKNLVEDIINMLIDEGTLDNVESFEELDQGSKQMILGAVNKLIKRKLS